MVASQASNVIHYIRTLALHQHDGVTDGNLLDMYVRQRDEEAFEALVGRHGRMVLGVCRRIVGNSHDAEDAFQATFLVLVRKAASIRPAGMVGNWLYGVARRTALEARRSAAKRRAKEAQVVPPAEMPEDPLGNLRPLLDQELDRLPDKYRAVVVLCDLEGRTRKEASQQLGLPEGTVASRRARARNILTKRLTRHGVTLSTGALSAAFAQEAAASTPLSLVFATVRAATAYAAGSAAVAATVSAPVAALTEGVLRAMLLSKLKITLVLLAVIGVVGTGVGGVSFRAGADDQSAVPGGPPQVAQADDKTSLDRRQQQNLAPKDLDKLQGSWRVVSSQVGDEKASSDEVARRKVTVNGNILIYEYGNEQKEKQEGTIKLDPKTKAFDWSWTSPQKGATMLGIYELKGDDLKIGFGNDDSIRRPKRFVMGKDDVVWLLVLKRDKAEQNEKKALNQYQETFLKVLRLSNEIAKAKEKKAPDERNPPDQVKQILDMVLKGMQAYQDSKGGDKKPERPDQDALDLYGEAFLKAFQISSEIAKAKAKGQAKIRPEDEAVFDAYGPAFVQAYERAKTLKKTLEEQKASDGKGDDKAIEALDVFIKAGKEFEQAVKLRAKTQAVEHAKKEIESALSRVEKTAHDRQMWLEALDEIERAVKDMRKNIQEGKERK